MEEDFTFPNLIASDIGPMYKVHYIHVGTKSFICRSDMKYLV